MRRLKKKLKGCFYEVSEKSHSAKNIPWAFLLLFWRPYWQKRQKATNNSRVLFTEASTKNENCGDLIYFNLSLGVHRTLSTVRYPAGFQKNVRPDNYLSNWSLISDENFWNGQIFFRKFPEFQCWKKCRIIFLTILEWTFTLFFVILTHCPIMKTVLHRLSCYIAWMSGLAGIRFQTILTSCPAGRNFACTVHL